MPQVNKILTILNLKYNHLGPKGSEALVKSLEVVFTFSVSNSLSLHDNQLSPSLLYMNFCVQVNTSITELNLQCNNLDHKAGKALRQALEVSPIFIVISLSP